MNWFKKILFFTGLSILLLFSFKGKSNAIDTIQQENSSSYFSNDSLQASAFIQPQVAPTFLVNFKINDYSIVKWHETFLVSIPDFKILKSLNTFLTQDINRCEKVSLLLFPFHSFW